eukprot:8007236-Pyramimonas_sp.AAC.1
MGCAAPHAIEARRCVLPGDGFAKSMPNLILIWLLGRQAPQRPTVSLAAVMGDPALAVVVGMMRVAEDVAEA